MARSHAHCWLTAVLAVAWLASGCSSSARAQTAAAARHPAAAAPAPTPARTPAAPAPSAALAAAAPASPSAPSAPRRPPAVLWPTTRLFNVDRIDVRDIAARFGLKAAWLTRGKVMQLSDERGVRLRFEDRKPDFHLDGTRVFLGENTVLYKGSLYVGMIDVIKTIAPLLRPADHASQLPAPPKVIVLDAGHGGTDPGKQNLGLRLNEKDMTLDVVRRLKKVLEARGYQVLLTRSDDSRLAPEQAADLQRRADFANRAKADLFLCVHFNAVDPRVAPRVSGTETYVMTPQFQASTQPEKDKALISKPLPGNKNDFANVVLGYHLHRQVLAGLKTSDRGYKRARWMVLQFVECPAGYIEAAYLSNDAEARRVATPEFRQQIAQAIAAGVDAYAARLAQLQP